MSNSNNFLSNYFLLPLRLAIGSVFIVHGAQKLFGNIAGVTEFFTGQGIPLAGFFAIVVAVVEFFGGIFVLIGFFTRWVSILIGIVMIVAILVVHTPFKAGFTGSGGSEFPFTLLLICITLSITGSGKFSVDELLGKRTGTG